MFLFMRKTFGTTNTVIVYAQNFVIFFVYGSFPTVFHNMGYGDFI